MGKQTCYDVTHCAGTQWGYPHIRKEKTVFWSYPGGGGEMQTSLIIESNGNGKQKLDKLLSEGWTVVSITANHGKSYNDFLVILEQQ